MGCETLVLKSVGGKIRISLLFQELFCALEVRFRVAEQFGENFRQRVCVCLIVVVGSSPILAWS